MKGREGTQVFSPEDLAVLQSCFDEIVRIRRLPRPSPEADSVAQALILAFKRGVTDKAELLRLADMNSEQA